MQDSIHKGITKKIEKMKKGQLIFPADFRGIGTDTAIKMTFSRLFREKKIIRLAHGIYIIPEYDPLVGFKYPSLETIAQAIAKRDHARIRPAGTYALHKLGLSTQVPMKLVYLTDGAPRKINIGKASIKFKATTPKKLSLKGKISSLIIQAFEELGPKNISNEIIEKITPLLAKENPEMLKTDLMLAPAWIYQLLTTIYQNKPYDRTSAAK